MNSGLTQVLCIAAGRGSNPSSDQPYEGQSEHSKALRMFQKDELLAVVM